MTLRLAVLVASAACLTLTACGPGDPADDRTEPPPAEVVKGTTPPPAVAPSAGAAPASAAAETLTSAGLGPVRIGMTEQEAVAALGKPVNADQGGTGDPAGCHSFRPQEGPSGLVYLVEQGKVARISIYKAQQGPNATLRTDRGIGLGSTLDQIRAAYGEGLEIYPHKYAPEGSAARDVTFWEDAGKTRGVRFETDEQGQVEVIHAGGQAIQLVEGCS